jgi:hypothetical protein
MAFAAAFARPASSRFIRPGAASLWFPPRPFPALLWLAQRPTSAASTPRLRGAGTLPRQEMELRLLFSRCPLRPDEDFYVSLRIELGRRAWSLEHAIGAPRADWSAAPGADTDLNKLRARLVAEAHLGLAIVETAPIRYPRPVRNVLLARHARHIGQRLDDLLRHKEAGSLSDELTRLLDTLRQYS